MLTKSTKFGAVALVFGILTVLAYFAPLVGIPSVGLPLGTVGVALSIYALVAKPGNWWLALLALMLSMLPFAFVAAMLVLKIKC